MTISSSSILALLLLAASSLPREVLSFIALTRRFVLPRDSATAVANGQKKTRNNTPLLAFVSHHQPQPPRRRYVNLAAHTSNPDSAAATSTTATSTTTTTARMETDTATNTTTSTTTAAVTSNINHSMLLLYGGDYAGLSATFDCKTGKLIAVPEYLVPETLLEWGQAPSALEVLVSEDHFKNSSNIIMDDDNNKSNPIFSCYRFQRHTLSIMPAVGCGVDNLNVEKAPCGAEEVSITIIPQKRNRNIDGNNENLHQENEDESSLVILENGSLLYATTTAGGAAAVAMGIATSSRGRGNSVQHHHHHHHCMEATFAWPEQNNHRVRVMIPFTLTQSAADDAAANHDTSAPPPLQLQSPITVMLERQFDATSSSGTRANGGGLDGRSITKWLGPTLHASACRNFAATEVHDDKPPPNEETIMTQQQDDDAIRVVAAAAVVTSIISLPGNVTISHGFTNNGVNDDDVDDYDDDDRSGEIATAVPSNHSRRFWFLEIAHSKDENTRSVARRIFPLASISSSNNDSTIPAAGTAWTLNDIHAKSTVEYYSVQQEQEQQ